MKFEFSENVTLFFGAIESIAIDRKRYEVVINTISGGKYRKSFKSLDEAVDYLDELANKLSPPSIPKKQPVKKAAPKKPAKKTSK